MRLKWTLMVPVMLALTVLAFPLAFALPFFAQKRDGWLDNATRYGEGYFLPKWLNWFQTPDNDLDGDQGWREEHMQWRFKLPAALATYAGRVGWIWRNPAYGFGIERVGAPAIGKVEGNLSINDRPFVEGHCSIEIQDLWQYVLVKRLTSGKALYMNLGWNIKGALEGNPRVHIATFAFSPRVVSVE